MKKISNFSILFLIGLTLYTSAFAGKKSDQRFAESVAQFSTKFKEAKANFLNRIDQIEDQELICNFFLFEPGHIKVLPVLLKFVQPFPGVFMVELGDDTESVDRYRFDLSQSRFRKAGLNWYFRTYGTSFLVEVSAKRSHEDDILLPTSEFSPELVAHGYGSCSRREKSGERKSRLGKEYSYLSSSSESSSDSDSLSDDESSESDSSAGDSDEHSDAVVQILTPAMGPLSPSDLAVEPALR